MKKSNIDLTSYDKLILENMLNKGSLKALISKRIISLLELSTGKTYSAVRDISHLSCVSLGTLAQRYRAEGLNCLYDAPCSGRPIEIDGTSLSDTLTVFTCFFYSCLTPVVVPFGTPLKNNTNASRNGTTSDSDLWHFSAKWHYLRSWKKYAFIYFTFLMMNDK